jgi:hypothetical protein
MQVATDGVVMVERHGTPLRDDDLAAQPHVGQPGTELLRVGHGRRQARQLHRRRKSDDDLLPDCASLAVGQVVHLVEHDGLQCAQRGRLLVEHVAQHFGRHHDDLGLTVDAAITGQQADVLGSVPRAQIGVLLVGQCLDRRRVEALAAIAQRRPGRELTHDRLARPGRSGDEHRATGVQRGDPGDLEVVQREVVGRGEGGGHRGHCWATPAKRVAVVRPGARR